MWVKMEDLGDHKCWSSLVLTCINHPIVGVPNDLTHTHITLHNYSFFWGRPTLIHPHPFETPSYSRYCAKASSLVSAALCATAWCTSRRRSSLGGIAVRKRCHIFTWETKGASPRELYNWDVIDRNMIYIYIYIDVCI